MKHLPIRCLYSRLSDCHYRRRNTHRMPLMPYTKPVLIGSSADPADPADLVKRGWCPHLRHQHSRMFRNIWNISLEAKGEKKTHIIAWINIQNGPKSTKISYPTNLLSLHSLLHFILKPPAINQRQTLCLDQNSLQNNLIHHPRSPRSLPRSSRNNQTSPDSLTCLHGWRPILARTPPHPVPCMHVPSGRASRQNLQTTPSPRKPRTWSNGLPNFPNRQLRGHTIRRRRLRAWQPLGLAQWHPRLR